jgi:hypothetical protein
VNPIIHCWLALAAGVLTTVLKDKLHISDAHIHHILGLCAGVMGLALRMTWVKGELGSLSKLIVTPAVLLIGCLSLTGCAITPGEIQAGTTIMVGSGLNMAAIASPAEKERIKQDAIVVAKTVNQLIPTFFPGATSAALLNQSIDTSISIMKSKLNASPHGLAIVEMIQAAKIPFSAALGSSASPAAMMSPATQADALAFFTGVSSAIAMFVNDMTLMPPLQPATSTTVAPPPPAPAPAPVPPK